MSAWLGWAIGVLGGFRIATLDGTLKSVRVGFGAKS